MYLEYIRLGIVGLTLLVQLIKDLKQDRSEVDDVVDRGASFLAKVGELAKIKELSTDNLQILLPAVRELVKQIAELKKTEKE